MELFAELAGARGLGTSDYFGITGKDIRKEANAKALAEIKELHRTNPKYCFEQEKEVDFIQRLKVEVVERAAWVERGGSIPLPDGRALAAEQYAKNHFEKVGCEVVECESRPFHALFGVFCWMLIQDPSDPNNRLCGFGERSLFEEQGNSSSVIWTLLPDDFGTSGYARRRAADIDLYLQENIRDDKQDLLWTFDYWVDPSGQFRQYLWAYRQEDVRRARRIVELLQPEEIRRVLRYLVDDYWRNYLGWPDLLVMGNGKALFVEVKGPEDKLSDEQRRWIEQNGLRLHFDFQLFKIRRKREAG